MKQFSDWWRANPKARFYVRTFVVAVIAYVVSSLSQGTGGFDTWQSFAWGAFGAGANAVIGLFTPVEPLVGLRSRVYGFPEGHHTTHKTTHPHTKTGMRT